jgi:hypothetical protein
LHELANAAEVFETGLDLVDTMGARNSLEKMLAYQLAAAHRFAMKLSAHVNRTLGYFEGASPAFSPDGSRPSVSRRAAWREPRLA